MPPWTRFADTLSSAVDLDVLFAAARRPTAAG